MNAWFLGFLCGVVVELGAFALSYDATGKRVLVYNLAGFVLAWTLAVLGPWYVYMHLGLSAII